MMMSNNVNHNNNGVLHHQSFGDTTLTKVFVGGLAWETPLEAMREHFEKYGEILEAVIISDKLTGRSKGYGFVTFKDAESARKACADPSPLINGRRANCNLASLGARRPKPPPTTTTSPPPQGHNTGARATSTPPTNYVQWYYPTGAPPQATAASPFHHRRHLNHQAVPFYRYSPAYIPSNVNYNHKVNYGGANMNGHYYPGQPVIGANLMLPVYPFYQFHGPTVGLQAHMYPSTTVTPISTDPALMMKPKSVAPQAGI
nr:probable RNA-binding protein ARP1 isoform X1 [Ipomoea batatas]